MNAIKLLENDHLNVKKLFREFEDSGESAYATKQKLGEQVFRELLVHTKIEEEIFYPEVRSRQKNMEDLVAESFEEHHVVDLLMDELKGMEAKDEEYEPKFKVLMENVRHHIEEEEGQMFPRLEALRGELDELGDRMAQRKEQLMGAAAR